MALPDPERLRGSQDEARSIDAGMEWEMELLRQLNSRFPTPAPLDSFDGRAFRTIGEETWITHTYLPGDPIGWRSQPPLEELGAFLARYHATVAGLDLGPRPGTEPITDLLMAVTELDARSLLAEPTDVADFLRLRALVTSQHHANHDDDNVAIHGDFTVDNVLVHGEPLRCSGLIDFGMALVTADR